MNQPQIRVVLIDDEDYIHMAIKSIISEDDSVSLVGSGYRGEDGLKLYEQYQPDIVLMDVVMPGIGGIEATRQILEHYPKARIMILSAAYDHESVRTTLEHGAKGYIVKGELHYDLINSIRATFQDKSVFSPVVTDILLHSEDQEKQYEGVLTDRELEVLRHIATGRSNPEIGKELGISERTIRFHTQNILVKLKVNNRTEALVYAAKAGLL